MIQEFKDFINRSNVVDAAVGLIMALAFVPVVDSLVEDVVLPVVGRVSQAPDFGELKIGLGGSEEVTLEDGSVVTREAAIRYGEFINEILAFLIIAFVVFLMVKAYNRATGATEEQEDDGPSEIDVLIEIRDRLGN